MLIPLGVLQEAGLRIGTALGILAVSVILSKYSSGVVRRILSTRYDNSTIPNLLLTVYRGVLWFSVSLVILSTLGFSEIAAAMGTAAGFVALGVSFALKDLISDTVAGVYLAKDPDFNNGDRVNVDGNQGVVTDVGLRKSRLELENGDTRILNNSDVERKWTLINDSAS